MSVNVSIYKIIVSMVVMNASHSTGGLNLRRHLNYIRKSPAYARCHYSQIEISSSDTPSIQLFILASLHVMVKL